MNSPLPLLFVFSSPQQKGSFLQPLKSVGILLWSSSVTVWLINTKCQHRSVKSLPCCMTLTSLFTPASPLSFPLSPVSRPASHSLPVTVPGHFSKCRFPLWWLYPVSSCLPCCPWGGALAGGHTHQHRLLEAVRGRKSSQRAPHPLGSKRCVRLPVA